MYVVCNGDVRMYVVCIKEVSMYVMRIMPIEFGVKMQERRVEWSVCANITVGCAGQTD
jgi:hypothetical protein